MGASDTADKVHSSGLDGYHSHNDHARAALPVTRLILLRTKAITASSQHDKLRRQLVHQEAE